MSRKMNQVTDSIHGTIYFSKLEAELISTPYFYRLHDIYQSSTAYMTYPTNRTKRYEYSLGTMELASAMIFSSLSNADGETKIVFFKELLSRFKDISEIIMCSSEDLSTPYLIICDNELNDIYNKIIYKYPDLDYFDAITRCIKEAVKSGCFNDLALDQYQFYPMAEFTMGLGDETLNYFLYRCILEALRIVSLFHDAGHPPYSHIIETELYNLYHEIVKGNEEDWNKEKVNEFIKVLTPYATRDKSKAFKCNTYYSKDLTADSQLHERIGLSLLQSVMNNVIPNVIKETMGSTKEFYDKISNSLFYIAVMEFSLAILVEKDNFFKSLHKIVDGVVDADRLDYIMRDSLNSGVDWGTIPYKRIINSSKLILLKEDGRGNKFDENDYAFDVEYQQKVEDDIVDLLLIRYKIYARINFHHRCMKTTVALQSSVRELAINYLKSPSESDVKQMNGQNTGENKNKDEIKDPSIAPEIRNLWMALNAMRGGERAVKIIQWNDSWLITVLHHALIELYMRDDIKYKVLKENLEEILMNKKRYFSLIKRGNDSKRFVEGVYGYMKLTKDKLEEMEQNEQKKKYLSQDSTEENLLTAPQNNAEEALKRIRQLKPTLKTGGYGKIGKVSCSEKSWRSVFKGYHEQHIRETQE